MATSRCGPLRNNSMSRSLETLVRIYRKKHGPRLAEYLGYFRRLDSLTNAIYFACHCRDGKIHGHQHLVGKKKLEQARKNLVKHADEIERCESLPICSAASNSAHRRSSASACWRSTTRRFGSERTWISDLKSSTCTLEPGRAARDLVCRRGAASSRWRNGRRPCAHCRRTRPRTSSASSKSSSLGRVGRGQGASRTAVDRRIETLWHDAGT